MKDCIDLIYEQSKRFPNFICVVDHQEEIDYKSFFLLVQKIASYLSSFSESPKVVINLRQGIKAYATIIGALLAGGYYCPIYIDAPFERKKKIINQILPDIIVTDENIALDITMGTQCQIIEVNALFENDFGITNLEDLLTAPRHELAYIIYTSGSSGEPKGVMVGRDALNKFLEWSLTSYKCTHNDRWAQYSLLSFDLSVIDIFTALCSGATLIAINDSASKMRPANLIDKYNITVWHSVPAAVDFMIKNEASSPANLGNVRLMSFCGEPLYSYHLEYLFYKNPELIVFNTYGPTEGTLFCTWILLNKCNYKLLTNNSISIGEPIPGWNLSLRDSPEHKGTQELIIYGNYLAKGYINNNSQKFCFLDMGGKLNRAFITGDLVRKIDGVLYFVGRNDRQIKLRGNRIELDEIDFFLKKFTGSRSLSLLFDGAIHSFIENCKVDDKQLKLYLRENLEKFKVPNFIYYIENFPLSANYKTDRMAFAHIIQNLLS